MTRAAHARWDGDGKSPKKKKARNVRFGLLGLGVGLTTLLTPIIGTGQAFADYAPQPGDIVGVGGDTPQYILDFVSNNDTNGDYGYNSAGAYNRLVYFDATPDGNGRSAYAQNSTESSPAPLNPTDVLRAGTFPVLRVSSSGNAISTLLADTGSQETINYIASASLPSATQEQQAVTDGWGGLHVVEIATDSVQIAVNNETADVGSGNPETNAPSGLSVQDLLNIYKGTYTTWGQIPGYSGTTAQASQTIIPLETPTSSSIWKTFIADLTTANGGTPTLGNPNIVKVEQNDPTAITGLGANAANAIVPFSAGRLALWNDGYFHTPNASGVALPIGAVQSPGVTLLTGTPGDGTVYKSPITDYIIFRQKDASSTTPFQPGGTENWVETLFSNPGGAVEPYVESIGQPLITSAGVTATYNDYGTNWPGA